MARKKKFLSEIKETAPEVLGELDESPAVAVEEPAPEPEPEPVVEAKKTVEEKPPIPEKVNGVNFIMECPPDKKPFWINSGYYIFYDEIPKIDSNGFAHVKKKNTVLAMEKEGFRLVD